MNLARKIIHQSPQEGGIEPPYLIAEAGVNHEGNLDTAYRLIDEAREGGADAIKFQTYRANSLASKNSPAYWDTKLEPTQSQFLLFKKYDSFWKDEFEKLKRRCDESDIEFISTPFDIESAHFLNDLMDVFKISSSDITNKPFIECICDYGKPVLLSTGASNHQEIDEALSWITSKVVPVALMHCVLNYPTLDQHANLNMIRGLKLAYPEITIGYSDHTLPGDMKILEIATLLGAQILEKHFTFDKTLIGNDHYHAMDKDDLLIFSRRMQELFSVLGRTKKVSLKSEALARKNARRSLVAARHIAAGTVIEMQDLTWKRPALGISPREIDQVIGKTTIQDLAEDDLLTWDKLQ